MHGQGAAWACISWQLEVWTERACAKSSMAISRGTRDRVSYSTVCLKAFERNSDTFSKGPDTSHRDQEKEVLSESLKDKKEYIDSGDTLKSVLTPCFGPWVGMFSLAAC